MSINGQNVGTIKYSNRSLLLNILYFEGAQSRKALAKKSGLTAAAITMIINELIEDKAVVETEKITASGRLGRNEQLLDLNYTKLFVVGVRIAADISYISLTRLDSKLMGECAINTSLIKEKLYPNGMAVIVRELAEKHSIQKESIVGAGITIRGVVDNINGISIDSYGILDINCDIGTRLYESLAIPVVAENNVRAMLRADIVLRHAKPARSTLFIKYGPGVGGALTVGQSAFTGSGFKAVELGHTCVEIGGKPCLCGKNGCLETIVSYQVIVQHIMEIFSESNTPFLFRICKADRQNVSINKVFLAYENNDAAVTVMLDNVIKYLALSIVNCSQLFDPEVVLLSSEAFLSKRFLSKLQQYLIDFCGNHNPRYLIVTDGNKLESSGPSAIAIQSFLDSGGYNIRRKKSDSKGSEI